AWLAPERCERPKPAAEKLTRLFKRFLAVEVPKARGAPSEFDGHLRFFSDERRPTLFSSLAVRYYTEGVRRPARLVVFERKRTMSRLSR
ncbi:MAG: hypothetical protein AAF322_17680, partial [Pseudomonadota bacterium]